MERVAGAPPLIELLLRSRRRPEAWAVALGIGIVVVARWAALGGPSARSLVGGVLIAVVAAALVGVSLERGRPIIAAAVLLVSSTTVLAAVADGRWQGIVALTTVALAAWSERRAAAAALAIVSAIALVLWWRSGFDRGRAPGPAWREVAGETGSIVRRAISSVGTDELFVPLSGALVWWIGIGVVVGAALVGGRVARAAWVPVALTVLVLGIWAIRLWRGSVDPIGGTWIVATGVVLTAACAGSGSLDPPAEQRMTVTITAMAAFTLAVAFVRELRPESAVAAVFAAVGAAVVGLSPVAPLLRRRPQP